MLVCVAACEPARLMRAVVLTQRAPAAAPRSTSQMGA